MFSWCGDLRALEKLEAMLSAATLLLLKVNCSPCEAERRISVSYL